jgi:hypothetical protein
MNVAKVAKLKAVPSVWANLSFEVGGIVQESNVVLGQPVTAFDFPTFYSNFGSATETSFIRQAFRRPGGGGAAIDQPLGVKVSLPANLYNSADIYGGLGGAELMALRAEGIKSVLDKACAIRANAYYGKYQNQADVIAQMRKNYLAANQNSKSAYLANLIHLANLQFNELGAAYNDDFRNGVVRATTSHLQLNPGNTTSTTAGGPTTVTTGAPETQDMTYMDYGYRVPSIEANAQNSRAQISLMDEQFAQFMFGQYLPNLENVFQNELTSIDMDVKRLQVAYFNTILMSPINGVVTGVYKQVGDAVIAGETVVRVENNSTVNLVGVLIYRRMLALGANVTVKTSLASSTTSATVIGTITAVRGDESGDDRWAVVISCNNNDTGGHPILPLNYNFDFDDTTVTIA